MARWGRVRLYRFTYRAVAARGSSCQNVVPRTCRGLPGAWAAAPAQGGAHGSGRGLDALVDESPGAGDRQVTWIRGRWWARPPGVAAVAVLARPGSPVPGRRPRCRRPVRVLVAPADDAAVAHGPRDEGGATRNPVPRAPDRRGPSRRRARASPPECGTPPEPRPRPGTRSRPGRGRTPRRSRESATPSRTCRRGRRDRAVVADDDMAARHPRRQG